MNTELFIGLGIGIFTGATAAGSYIYFRQRQQLANLQAELTTKAAELLTKATELEVLSKSQTHMSEVSDQMTLRFEALASKIFDEKTARFSDQSLKNIGLLIEPFREKLKDFEKKVEDSYSTERAERGTLRGEIGKLIDLNLRMSNEAENLTKALKGDNKTMGNWGELILETILEKSGLRKGDEYTVQSTDMGLKNDQGQSIRPDVIIHLPEGKHIIVDAKVSLTAYEAYVSEENVTQKESFGKQHLESIKRHIDGLSQKRYFTAEKLISPDFVMLFMPIEPAFALAFRQKPDLLEYAWSRQIALVSPTTLLTTLKTVGALWKTERQERNALEIAKRGGALYDKFVALVEDLQDLGEKLETTQKKHAQVMNKLSDGSGNLIRQVEMIKELGAKTEKKLELNQPN